MVMALLAAFCPAQEATPPGKLKVHAIFASNMVLQRGKPITVWGWAEPGKTVSVTFGKPGLSGLPRSGKDGVMVADPLAPVTLDAVADAAGRWQAGFPAHEANFGPLSLTVASGNEKIGMENIAIGDVWVMNGQSNMAFPLGKVQESDIESAQAHLPLLRFFAIDPNEQSELAEDIPAERIATGGWAVSDPETSREFSAIGYVFGARLQRALQIPIGVIKNARGGASIESLVPGHKFDDHPLAKRYADHVKERIAAFDPQAESELIWQRQLARAKGKGLPEDKWPKKPVNAENLTSWNIPGKSPSDMASCYNGMFGVFKGYNIKGVLFHQGYNNAMASNCRPKRYRVLMKLMVEGWREDFNDPALPVGVIGFCAGGDPQTDENFEREALGGAAFIREAQRLGLADVGDPANTAFLPAYDIQVPGLHPAKKREHGERAARWALDRIYKMSGVDWDSARLVSAEPQGDMMVLKFDKSVMPDDWSTIIEGFSIAGKDGKFHQAHARFPLKRGGRPGGNARQCDTATIRVWSPLVKDPEAVRYGWATSPLGNLKVDGKPWLPLQSFRTDSWDYPEVEDPAVLADTGGKKAYTEASAFGDERRLKEAEVAKEIIERLKTLSAPIEETAK
jgi:sialate O-acetylesterase